MVVPFAEDRRPDRAACFHAASRAVHLRANAHARRKPLHLLADHYRERPPRPAAPDNYNMIPCQSAARKLSEQGENDASHTMRKHWIRRERHARQACKRKRTARKTSRSRERRERTGTWSCRGASIGSEGRNRTEERSTPMSAHERAGTRKITCLLIVFALAAGLCPSHQAQGRKSVRERHRLFGNRQQHPLRGLLHQLDVGRRSAGVLRQPLASDARLGNVREARHPMGSQRAWRQRRFSALPDQGDAVPRMGRP